MKRGKKKTLLCYQENAIHFSDIDSECTVMYPSWKLGAVFPMLFWNSY